MKREVASGGSFRLVRLTPPGRGAIATLLVEGPGAQETVGTLLHMPGGRTLGSVPWDGLAVGHFGSFQGEEVVVRCRCPESVEIHCHAGHAAIAKIEATLAARGGRTVSWQDWTLDCDPDPIVAAARLALARARTERTALLLLDQLCGALRRTIDRIVQLLTANKVLLASRELDDLLRRAPFGLHLTDPWHVVLAGPPNVGKSSLINALVGYQRAIVHDLPGTTRDVVTATTAVEGWPVELSDTAGLCESGHPIEQAGIALGRQKMAGADLLILVFDSSQPWSDSQQALLGAWPEAVVVHNKCDLLQWPGKRPGGMAISALTGEGIEALVHVIATRLVADPPPPGAAIPFDATQIGRLRAAHQALAHGDIPGAIDLLTGI